MGVVRSEKGEMMAETFVGKLSDAYWQYQILQDKLYNYVLDMLGLTGDLEYWPFEEVSFDLVDWSGASIEVKGAEDGLEFTDANVVEAKELGFGVICVHYQSGINKRFRAIKAEG